MRTRLRPLRLPRPSMLPEEAQVPAEVLVVQAARMRGTAHVDALRSGKEDDAPPRFPGPEMPVGLLAEEEEALVGDAELRQGGTANEHARTHDGLHVTHLVVLETAGVERVQGRRAGRELAQTEILGRETPERREAADRALESAVGVREARRHERRRRTRVGEVDQEAERVSDEPRVRVQEEHVAALRLPHTRVPPRGEAEVLGLDHGDLGKALPHEGDRAVA